MRSRIESHLGSRDVARTVYGSIIGLALVVALEQHPPSAGHTAVAIVATAIAVALAETYSEVVGTEARERRRVLRPELRTMADEASAVAFGAAFPALFFVLAAAGAIELDAAFALAKWTGLGLIFAYGFAGARLAGAPIGRALLHAAAVGAVGGALILLKALVH